MLVNFDAKIDMFHLACADKSMSSGGQAVHGQEKATEIGLEAHVLLCEECDVQRPRLVHRARQGLRRLMQVGEMLQPEHRSKATLYGAQGEHERGPIGRRCVCHCEC